MEAAHSVSDNVSINFSLFHLLVNVDNQVAISKAIFADHYYPGGP